MFICRRSLYFNASGQRGTVPFRSNDSNAAPFSGSGAIVVPSKIKTHLILEEALVWFQTTTRLFDGSSELASCNN